MGRYRELERATFTAHRLSRDLLPLERKKMFMEVLRIVQEETGASFDEVLAVLQEAADRMQTRVVLQQERQEQWIDDLRSWILQESTGAEKQGFIFIPVAKCQKWASEQRVPLDLLIAALKNEEGFGKWVESGAVRYSKSIRFGKDTPRCYGFTRAWLEQKAILEVTET
jgi:hypothetical protein